MIDLILNKMSSHAWNQIVMTSAFKVLSAMTNFFSSIPNNAEVCFWIRLKW